MEVLILFVIIVAYLTLRDLYQRGSSENTKKDPPNRKDILDE